MSPAKKPHGTGTVSKLLTLSPDSAATLERLAETRGEYQTTIVEIAVRELAARAPESVEVLPYGHRAVTLDGEAFVLVPRADYEAAARAQKANAPKVNAAAVLLFHALKSAHSAAHAVTDKEDGGSCNMDCAELDGPKGVARVDVVDLARSAGLSAYPVRGNVFHIAAPCGGMGNYRTRQVTAMCEAFKALGFNATLKYVTD